MPDTPEQLPSLPPDDANPSWLARNRKLAILLGAVALLIVAAIVTIKKPSLLGLNRTVNNSSAAANTSAGTNNINTYTRPTFQRSTAVNAPAAALPTYAAPSTQDLKNAINQLQTQQLSNNNSNQ